MGLHLDCTRLHNQSKRSEGSCSAHLTLTEERLHLQTRELCFPERAWAESHDMKANMPFITFQKDTKMVDFKAA